MKQYLLVLLLILSVIIIFIRGIVYNSSKVDPQEEGSHTLSNGLLKARREEKHPFLTFDESLIPVLKERIKREPYKTWWNQVLLTDQAHTKAFAWLLTDKKAYADEAKNKLLSYVWPKLDPNSPPQRMEPNSHWVKLYCQAYDILYNYSGLSSRDKVRIEDKLANIAEDLYKNVLIVGGGQNPGNQRTLGASALGTIALTIPNYSKKGYHTPEQWLERALEVIFREDNFEFWYGDGFFVEGVGYSIYMGLLLIPFIYQYDDATEINLFEHPVISNWLVNWGYQEMPNGLHANIGSTIMDYHMSFHREILVNKALGDDAPLFKFLYDRKIQAYNSKKKPYPTINMFTLVDLICYHDDSIPSFIPDKYEPTRFFSKSQHAILGNGWDEESIVMWVTGKDWHMSDSLSMYYSHEDVGNFILTAYGELLVVDAGYDH